MRYGRRFFGWVRWDDLLLWLVVLSLVALLFA